MDHSQRQETETNPISQAERSYENVVDLEQCRTELTERFPKVDDILERLSAVLRTEVRASGTRD